MTEHAAGTGIDPTRQWLLTAGVTGVLALVGVAFLAHGSDDVATARFVAGAAVGLTAVSAVIRRCLEAARREAGPEPISGATWITLARGAATVVLAGFLFAAPTGGWTLWVPAALFGLAAGFDAVDGAVARATDTVSTVGGRLDVEIDSITVLVGALLAVGFGGATVAFLLVGVARYAFVAGIAARRRRDRPVYGMDPSDRRRAVGAATMIATWLVLLPVPGRSVSWALSVVVLIPFVASFGRDWLVVSGRLDVGTDPK